MRRSIQTIEDYYVQKGLRDKELRRALELDDEYQRLLAERKKKIAKHFPISRKDQKSYVLSTNEDYKILAKIYKLERKKLKANDRELVRFVRSQLELDWRKPLAKMLDKLLKRYE